MECPRCRQSVNSAQGACSHCGAPIRRSLWARIRGAFSVTRYIEAQTRITINVNGERREYESLQEVPAEYRGAVEKALTGQSPQKFTVKDLSGRERVYQSLDEMPRELREALEKARGGKQP